MAVRGAPGMTLALALSVLSVAAGAAVALLPRLREGGLGPIRTFALAAAGAAILGHLLPEAVEELGAMGLLAFATALAAPAVIERVAHAWFVRQRRERAGERFGQEVSFAALLVHQLGDGVGLHHYAAAEHPSLDAALALSLHTIPVAALVVLRFSEGGRRWRAGLTRAAALAGATAIGVGLGASVVSTWLHAAGPWTAAVVSGLLLHVLGHDLGTDAPKTRGARWLELGALCAGLALVATAVGITPEHAGHSGELLGAGHTVSLATRLLHKSADLALDVAPTLLLALVVSTLVDATLGSRSAHLAPRGARGFVRDSLRGLGFVLASPKAAWSSAEAARTLRDRGVSAATIAVLVMVGSGLGLDTLLLTAQLGGPSLALARAGGVVTIALLGAAIGSGAKPEMAVAAATTSPSGEVPVVGLARRLGASLDALIHRSSPWLALGLLAAGFVHELTPADALAPWAGRGWLAAVVALGALLVPGPPLALTPLAVVLLARGLGPGAALAGLLAGGLREPVLGEGRALWGNRRALAAGLGGLGIAIGLGWTLDRWIARPSTALLGEQPHEHEPWRLAACAILGLLLLRHLYRCGLRGWLSTILGHGHRHWGGDDHAADHGLERDHGHEHEHAHEHGHGHGHGHDRAHGHAHGDAPGHDHRHEGSE